MSTRLFGAALVAALALPACKETSREDAFAKVKDEVLATNGWDERNVIVYGPTKPLEEGDRIAPVLEPDGTPGVPVTLDREKWFFWIDADPYARFRHETMFVFFDPETKAIETSREQWYPSLDGEDTLRSFDPASPLRVFGAPIHRNTAPLTIAQAPGGAGGHPAYPCCNGYQAIVVNGEPGNANTTADAANMSAALTARGFAVTPIVAANNAIPSLQAARQAFYVALMGLGLKSPPLCQLVVYYAGHGSSGTMVFGPDENGPIQSGASDIYKYVDDIDACEIALILDACDSGAAINDWRLYNMMQKGAKKNVAVYAACEPIAKAYTDFSGGGQYTNAQLAHMRTLPANAPLPLLAPASFTLPAGTTLGNFWSQTPQSAVFTAPANCPCCPPSPDGGTGTGLTDGGPDGGPGDAAMVGDGGLDGGVAEDSGQVAMAPPSASPINAIFDQPTFSTTYSLYASDPDHPAITSGDLTITWSGTDCGESMAAPLVVDPELNALRSEFVWFHPHPPCDETTDHADRTITARITDGVFTVVCGYPGAGSGVGSACALE